MPERNNVDSPPILKKVAFQYTRAILNNLHGHQAYILFIVTDGLGNFQDNSNE